MGLPSAPPPNRRRASSEPAPAEFTGVEPSSDAPPAAPAAPVVERPAPPTPEAAPEPVTAPVPQPEPEPVPVPQAAPTTPVTEPVREPAPQRPQPAVVQAPPVSTPVDTATAPAASVSPPPTAKRRRGGRKSASEPLTVTGSIRKQQRTRKLIVAGFFTLVGFLALNTIWGLLTPPPSVTDVASAVEEVIPGDGALAPVISVGQEFATAYLTPATTDLAADNRTAVLNRLTAGKGGEWVTGVVPQGQAQRLIDGPYLERQPEVSGLFPGLYSVSFLAWLQQGQAAPQRVRIQVTAGVDEAGTAYVALPPSVLYAPDATTAPDITFDRNDEASTSAETRFTEFIKAWAALPLDADEARLVSFSDAFVTPQVRGDFVYRGLGGRYALVAVEQFAVTDVTPGDPSYVTGYATVKWRQKDTEQELTSSYRVWMRQAEGRWLIEGLLPL